MKNAPTPHVDPCRAHAYLIDLHACHLDVGGSVMPAKSD